MGSDSSAPPPMHSDVSKYNRSLAAAERKIAELLAKEIDRALPEAENKVWHAHPVWFLEGNPVVGYSKLRDSVGLLFWSGQSFAEPGLKAEGSFKAAEARFTAAGEVKTGALRRWLKKSRDIQWDYQNIVRHKGRLERLKWAEGRGQRPEGRRRNRKSLAARIASPRLQPSPGMRWTNRPSLPIGSRSEVGLPRRGGRSRRSPKTPQRPSASIREPQTRPGRRPSPTIGSFLRVLCLFAAIFRMTCLSVERWKLRVERSPRPPP